MSDHEKKNEGFFAGVAATAKAVRDAINEPLDQAAKRMEPLTRDGYLAAGLRQGFDEIGEALKAFPQSIQVQESGSIWNPTQGEIADARSPIAPSPSEIADGHGVHGPNRQPEGQEHDLPSPSDIADRPQGQRSFVEDEMRQRQRGGQDGNAGNDQSERGQGRSPADDQRERDRGRSR